MSSNPQPEQERRKRRRDGGVEVMVKEMLIVASEWTYQHLLLECCKGHRGSGVISGVHGPGLSVVPLMLHWEFLERHSLGFRAVVDMSVLLFPSQLWRKSESFWNGAFSLLLGSNSRNSWLIFFQPKKKPSKKQDKAKRAYGTSFMLQYSDGRIHFAFVKWVTLLFLLIFFFYLFSLCVCLYCFTSGTATPELKMTLCWEQNTLLYWRA